MSEEEDETKKEQACCETTVLAFVLIGIVLIALSATLIPNKHPIPDVYDGECQVVNFTVVINNDAIYSSQHDDWINSYRGRWSVNYHSTQKPHIENAPGARPDYRRHSTDETRNATAAPRDIVPIDDPEFISRDEMIKFLAEKHNISQKYEPCKLIMCDDYWCKHDDDQHKINYDETDLVFLAKDVLWEDDYSFATYSPMIVLMICLIILGVCCICFGVFGVTWIYHCYLRDQEREKNGTQMRVRQTARSTGRRASTEDV